MATEDDETTAKEAAPEADEQSVAADMQSSVATIVTAIVAAIKATSLRPPPERVVVEEAPTANSNLDGREFDEEDEMPEPEYVAKHKWGLFHEGKMIEDGFACEKCGAKAPKKNSTSPCLVAEAEHAVVKLANCLLAARGKISDDAIDIQGAYGWSATYEAVKELRAEYDQMRVSLEAECAANADKVQIIDRQCQERRAIKAAVEKGDMPGLREILNPPESDEPESVEKTETKTVVLDVGPDHLKIVEIENVTALRAERDRLKKSYAKARTDLLCATRCTCPQWGHPHAPTCRLRIAQEKFPESP